jgi:CRISPR-associated endonuclease Csn1
VGTTGTEKKYLKADRPWVLAGDLKFLADLARNDDTWDNIYFPEQRLDALEARCTDNLGKVNVSQAIKELLGSINDPVVRHRLGVFSDRLTKLRQGSAKEGIPECGIPETVVLEFVREDFMGERAKRDLQKFINDREKARKEAGEQAAALGVHEKSGRLKYELFKSQGGLCLYCQQSFKGTDLADYRIEHIVPRAQGGPDAMVNYVLAHEACNDAKGDKTPFEWKHHQQGWDGYKACVEKYGTTLRNKKVQLLLREDAAELVGRYTALAETAWISKLAQKIVSLHFGWTRGIDKDGKRRVIAISGGLTARIRRKYRLNSLLNPAPSGTTDLDDWEAKAEKNRKDHRHHALDAMVINFLPQWMRDEKKGWFFRFPEPVRKNPRSIFEKEIADVMPRHIACEKVVLAETNYGASTEGDDFVIVQRVPLRDLAMKPVALGKSKFDLAYLKKQVQAVRDDVVRKGLDQFVESGADERDWVQFCTKYRLPPSRMGTLGPRVGHVTVKVGAATEYKEMSKDGRGTWRKGLGSHKGQIIYWDQAGILAVRPVYAHGSVSKEIRSIESLGGKAKICGFFQSECAVRTTNLIPPSKYKLVVQNDAKQKRRMAASDPLPPCELTLKTIVTKDLIAEMTLANNARVVAPLDVWIKAGLTRL